MKSTVLMERMLRKIQKGATVELEVFEREELNERCLEVKTKLPNESSSTVWYIKGHMER